MLLLCYYVLLEMLVIVAVVLATVIVEAVWQYTIYSIVQQKGYYCKIIPDK